MRFLCLHGMGTNSKVLDSQLSAIRYELDSVHTYDFVDGVVPVPLAEELSAFFPANDSYFDYFDDSSIESMLASLRDLDSFIRDEGPYDGVIAFSQGACLVATYLVQLTIEKPSAKLPFKCAIFLCGGVPPHPSRLKEKQIHPLDAEINRALLPPDLATAHITAINDRIMTDSSETLYQICHPKLRHKFSHNLGHSIPGAQDKDVLYGALQAIRRTIDQAAMAS